MKKDLTIETMAICEYSSQDSQSRNMLIGIFPNLISFDEPPKRWPRLWLHAVIKPNSSNFDFDLYFCKSGQKKIANFKMEYRNDEAPDARERIGFNAQIPPAKFTGPGLYVFGLAQGKKVLFEQEYTVEIGEPSEIKLGIVTGSPEINLE